MSGLGSFLRGAPPRANPGDGDARIEELARAAAARLVGGQARPDRPRLTEALGALSGEAPEAWTRRWQGASRGGGGRWDRLAIGDAVRVGRSIRSTTASGASVDTPVVIADPREAWEAFESRDLAPPVDPALGARWFAADEPSAFFAYDLARVGGDPPSSVLRTLHDAWVVPTGELPRGCEPGDALADRRRGADGGRRFGLAFAAAPHRLDLCAALAADPAGVARAEGLALELLARMAPWLSEDERARPFRLAWRIAQHGDGDFPPQWSGGSLSGALAFVESLAGRAGIVPRAEPAADLRIDALAPDGTPEGLRAAVRGAVTWARAQDLALPVPAVELDGHRSRTWVCPPPGFPLPRTFADAPNPFVPLLGIFALGYGVCDTMGPNLTLESPPLVVPPRWGRP